MTETRNLLVAKCDEPWVWLPEDGPATVDTFGETMAVRMTGGQLRALIRDHGLRPALDDVRDFHRAMADVYPEGADCTGRPGLTRRMSRMAYLAEEFAELELAVETNDVVEAADALADIVYFALGTAITWIGSERFARVWAEVHVGAPPSSARSSGMKNSAKFAPCVMPALIGPPSQRLGGP